MALRGQLLSQNERSESNREKGTEESGSTGRALVIRGCIGCVTKATSDFRAAGICHCAFHRVDLTWKNVHLNFGLAKCLPVAAVLVWTRRWNTQPPMMAFY